MVAIFPGIVLARPISPVAALQVAKTWIAVNPRPMHRARTGVTWSARLVRGFKNRHGDTIAYIVDLNPEGFVVVPADDSIEPVIAFSDRGHFVGSLDSSDTLSDLLLRDIPDRLAAAKSSAGSAYGKQIADRWAGLSSGSIGLQAKGVLLDTLSPVVDPMTMDTWSQPAPYSRVIPYGAPYTGCVATAMGQIIHFFRYPSSASGTNTVTFFGTSMPVSFNDSYDYSRMPASLVNPPATDAQIDQVSTLLYDCGIAVGMDYEATGSGATSAAIAPGYTNFMKYFSASWESGRDAAWTSMLEGELSAGFPTQFCIQGQGEGHSVVCDGWGLDGGNPVFHLNMGWEGAYNAWYTVPGFKAGGITWSVLAGYIYNIRIAPINITGNVTLSGSAFPGVRMASSSWNSVLTDSTGHYALEVGLGWSGTVTPVKPGYVFSPQSATYAKPTSDQSQDYSAIAVGPPSITITSPTTSGVWVTTSQPMSISGVASAAPGVGIVGVTWSNSTGGSGVCSGTSAWSAGSVPLQTGLNILTVTVTDATSNQATATLYVTYIGPPLVGITYPSQSGVWSTTQNSLNILGTAVAAPGRAISTVTWTNSEQSGVCSGTMSWSANAVPLQSGANLITIAAEDDSGLIGTTGMIVYRTQQGSGLPWPTFERDNSRSGQFPFQGPAGPTIKWSWPGTVNSSPVINSDGTVYVGSNDHNLYAFNPDGTVKWAYDTGSAIMESPTIGPDGTIYAGSLDYSLYAINPDGSPKWSFVTNYMVESCPAISQDGTIYFGSNDGNLYALNPDGSQQWATPVGNMVRSPAIGPDGTIYVPDIFGSLSAVDRSGNLKWKYSLVRYAGKAPLVGQDGIIYIGGPDGLYALNPNGVQKWFCPMSNVVEGSAAMGLDGTIYVGSFDNNLYAVNPDGTKKWAFETGNSIWSSPIIGTDGCIYIGSTDGYLYAVNSDGSERWACAGPGGHSSPAVGPDGTLFIGGGSFFAVGPGASWLPSVTITQPTTGGAYTTISPVLSLAGDASAVMDRYITQVTWTNANRGSGACVGTNSWNVDGISLKPGLNKLTVTAFDNTKSRVSALLNVTYTSFTISGAVRRADGTPVPGVTMTASDGTVCLTDSSGSYSFLVGYGWSGTIIPSKKGCLISPSSCVYPPVTSNQVQNYVGTMLPVVNITSPTWTGTWFTTTQPMSIGGTAYGDGSQGLGIVSVEWTNSLGGSGICDGTSPWSASEVALEDGANVITVIATDALGNMGSSGLTVYYPSACLDIWPTFQHDIRHTSLSYFSGPANPLQKWAYSGSQGESIYSSPVIGSDGTIYFGSTADCFYAVNPDGSKKWTFPVTNGVYSSGAVGSDGCVYVGSAMGTLYAINSNGSQRWAFDTGSWIYGSPTIGPDGTIYIGSYDGNLYAVNPDGSSAWAVPTGWVYGAPGVGPDGTIYVGAGDNNLHAIDPAGVQKWAFATGNSIFSSPTIDSEGTIYFGSYDDNFYAVNPDGTEKWAFKAGDTIDASPALGPDGTIYIVSNDGNLYAIGRDGGEKWAFAVGVTYASPVVGSDGTIYEGSYGNGKLYALNSDGSLRWVCANKVTSSASIGTGGMIYVGSYTGGLYAFGPTTISGSVNLRNYIGDKTTIPMTINLRKQGSTVPIENHAVGLDSAGNYSFGISTTGLTGTFSAWAKASHWLAQALPVTLDSSGNGAVSFDLRNGDVNGDNIVEDKDYALMGAAWYSQVGDPNYNVNADLNGDGWVEDQDYSILGLYWYQSGDL
jgi:outer membrane protein assembly factor BamB